MAQWVKDPDLSLQRHGLYYQLFKHMVLPHVSQVLSLAPEFPYAAGCSKKKKKKKKKKKSKQINKQEGESLYCPNKRKEYFFLVQQQAQPVENA